MMKKKLVLAVAAAAMVGTLAVGGTLAWFTDTETATNVVTTGKVDVAWYENGNEITEQNKGVNFTNVTPGATLKKEASIKNTGVTTALIRAEIVVDSDISSIVTPTFPMSSAWEYDGSKYYYYKKPLASGESSGYLITALGVDTNVGNSAVDITNKNVILKAEALQLDNVLDLQDSYELSVLQGAFSGKTIADLETTAAPVTN